MRDMTHEEITSFIDEWGWGTLIAVDGDAPYAIENCYGTDGKYLYCGSRPAGRMFRCLQENANVVYKICDSDQLSRSYRAVTIFGRAERLAKYEDVLYAARCIARQVEYPENAFDGIAMRATHNPESNFVRIAIEKVSGVVCGK